MSAERVANTSKNCYGLYLWASSKIEVQKNGATLDVSQPLTTSVDQSTDAYIPENVAAVNEKLKVMSGPLLDALVHDSAHYGNVIMSMFAALLLVNTPKKNYRAAIESEDLVRAWELVLKELKASNHLLKKMIKFNHNKLTAKRREWATHVLKGQGRPENPVAAVTFDWVKETLAIQGEVEEEVKEENPFAVSPEAEEAPVEKKKPVVEEPRRRSLLDIEEGDLEKVKALEIAPENCDKIWMAVWVLANGNSSETSKIIGNNFSGGWDYVKSKMDDKLVQDFLKLTPSEIAID